MLPFFKGKIHFDLGEEYSLIRIMEKASNKEQAAKAMAHDLEGALRLLKETNTLTLLLLSGGSAFTALDHIAEDVFGPFLTITVLDERYDPTNINNNFYQLAQTSFFEKAQKNGVSFIDTQVKEGQSAAALAEWWEAELRKWCTENDEGVLLATLGMGADGHVAGIMPFPEDSTKFHQLFDDEAWVASYDATGKNPFAERVTTTLAFLRQIDFAFAYVCGEKKANAFKESKTSGDLANLPARILSEIRSVEFYTDI